MADVDKLFDVRNALYIGNYQVCINEAQKSKVTTTELKEERDLMMYRAMIAQGQYSVAKNEINSESSTALQAVKRLATYLHKPADRADALAAVKKLQDDGISMTNPMVGLLSAMIYLEEQNLDDALRCLKAGDSIENSALVVQIYVTMDRPDMAKKELKVMQDTDDDSTLTQIATAWVHLVTGGDKLKEAFYIFQELVEKYGPTPMLLNGQACSCMLQGQWDDADSLLQLAQEKSTKDAETLVNTAVVNSFLNRPDVAARTISQLQDSFPNFAFTKLLNTMEASFDGAAAKYVK